MRVWTCRPVEHLPQLVERPSIGMTAQNVAEWGETVHVVPDLVYADGDRLLCDRRAPGRQPGRASVSGGTRGHPAEGPPVHCTIPNEDALIGGQGIYQGSDIREPPGRVAMQILDVRAPVVVVAVVRAVEQAGHGLHALLIDGGHRIEKCACTVAGSAIQAVNSIHRRIQLAARPRVANATSSRNRAPS